MKINHKVIKSEDLFSSLLIYIIRNLKKKLSAIKAYCIFVFITKKSFTLVTSKALLYTIEFDATL